MKIDFNTYYAAEDYKGLCEKAIQLGLDGLVMSNLPENKMSSYKGLKIFPAQEVLWKAVLEIPQYASREAWKRNMQKGTLNKVFHGKAQLLLPQGKSFLQQNDTRLYDLLEQTKKSGGAVIALQDDTNYFIVLEYSDGKHVYPFDATRIRPFSVQDINSVLPMADFPVGGSGASKPQELTYGKAFIVIDSNPKNQDELISAIKAKTKPKIFIHGKECPLEIEKTVKQAKPIINI